MEKRYYYDFMALVFVMGCFVLMKLIDNKTIKQMDVYVSKSKQVNPSHLSIIRKELDELNIIEYLGGKYSNAPLKSSNAVVAIINENTEFSIGRGQFGEITTAQENDIPVVAVFINKETIEVFSIEDIEKIDGGNWTNYAGISAEELAVYTIGEGSFKDYIENL